jgi:hypothetical protein
MAHQSKDEKKRKTLGEVSSRWLIKLFLLLIMGGFGVNFWIFPHLDAAVTSSSVEAE